MLTRLPPNLIRVYRALNLLDSSTDYPDSYQMSTGPKHCITSFCLLLALLLTTSCTNNPYRPGDSETSTYFSSFSEPPTKLDPAKAYYVHEGRIIDQIYEPPFTYHYLKRPYELIPLTAEAVPSAVYFGKDGRKLDDPDPPPELVGRAEYTVRIRPGIMYQPHPCFAKDADGNPLYRSVTKKDIEEYDYPGDFPVQGTRELRAADYALQVRRLADQRLASPIYSTLTRYLLGFDSLSQALSDQIKRERARRKEKAGLSYNREKDESENPILLDYMEPECPGIVLIDEHTYKLVLKKKYPQILYWMCMHFMAPMPNEALEFYAQETMIDKQFTINRWPVGTGPYFLSEFEPNKRIVLLKNPNYHEDRYPTEGSQADREAGLLNDAGKKLPFIERQMYLMEKEAIPQWNKFLQGYVDAAGISDDVFDQAIALQQGGDPSLSPSMKEKGIKLITGVDTTFYYMQFNMKDPVVGDYDEASCKLRQAISIALDYNEYLDIFSNGRGLLGQGPIPPGIFGYLDGPEGVNPYVDEWDSQRHRCVRKPIEYAKQLMKEAGYPDGRGPDGKALTLFFDHGGGMEAGFRSRFDWISGKFSLLGIKLKDRGTELSRFREKRQKGDWQISSSGWLADYPDPENFLFLFYGPNGLVDHGGVNTCNYSNNAFDEVFLKLETMVNSPKRQELINEAMDILRRDAPAAWMLYPISYSLQHEWYKNVKMHEMSYNVMKYRRIDAGLRRRRQREWNKPVLWPILLLIALLVAGSIPAFVGAYKRERGL